MLNVARHPFSVYPEAVPKRRSTDLPEDPDMAAVLEPLVEPVLERLDRHERILEELKTALDVQFKRTAAIQAQLDLLLATLKRSG